MKAYDGIFVSIVVNCCRKRFSWAMFCATVIALLATIPILWRYWGVNSYRTRR